MASVQYDRLLEEEVMHDHLAGDVSDLTATLDPRYLKIASNLSDLNNVATARTNLGLVAGGAGDIWVEKAGDTMTGNLNMGTYNLIGGTGVTDILKLQSTTGNGTLTSPAIQLLTGNNGATTAVTVLNNGNVGIGTTNPGAKLDVSAGNLDLDNTTNANQFGVISKNGTRFIHDFNYGNNGSYTTVGFNTFMGVNSGNFTMGSMATATTQSSYNTGMGYGVLSNLTTGFSNTAVGYFTLGAVTTGSNNSALGINAGSGITTGSQNVLVGQNALIYNKTGSSNVVLGYGAGFGVSNTSDVSGNTLVGTQAGYALQTNGNYNTLLGYTAGDNITTGARNIIIGYNTDAPSETAHDQLNIGNVIYGNLSTGHVGIGTTAPSYKLEVQGGDIYTSGDLRVAGDDLFMATNTANYFLMADGTNYNPTSPSDARTGLGLIAGGTGDIWVEKAGDTMTGNLVLNDSVSLALGTSSDFTISHTGTNTVFDNTFATGNTQMQLGTDTTATAFQVLNNTGTALFEVDGSGNVGIGTTAPADKLQVVGNVRANAFNAIGTLAYYVAGGGVAMIGNNGSTYGVIQSYSDTGGTGRSLSLNPNGGNVGIGTTSPEYKIQVYDSTSVSTFTGTTKAGLALGTYGIDNYNTINFYNPVWSTNPGARISGRQGSSGSYLEFGTSNNYANGITNTALTINPSGNVGIGTDAPAGRLHINGTADDQQLIVEAHSTQTNNIVEIHNSSSSVLISFDGVGRAIFNEQGDASADFRVESDTEANMLFLDADGNTDGTLYIGGNSATTSNSSRKGGLFFPVQAPTASAPAYVKGAIYFDTTLNKLMVGGATAWETVTSI